MPPADRPLIRHGTELWSHLGCRWPLIQAPMAGVQDAALAIAVSRAGGLGSLPAAMLTPDALDSALRQLHAALHDPSTGRTLPYNVNAFCHTPPERGPATDTAEAAWRERLQPYAAELGIDTAAAPAGAARAPFSHALCDRIEPFKPPVMSFHFGLPAPDLLRRVKAWGAVVLASATTVAEGLWLQAHGADAVIAQGLEAGGHRGHFLDDDLSLQQGLFTLLPQLVRALHVPVLAAGGIADAAGVAAAMRLGASGVQVGTAYLLSDEATTSPLHRAALASEGARHTALTRLFTGRPARGIVNRLMHDLGALNPAAPPFPLATAALVPLRAAAEARGLPDFTPLWAGQHAARCRPGPAAEITAALAQGFAPDTPPPGDRR
jgi:nitronate monooxygenase